MATAYTLTHNLYGLDEVVLAWLTALLKKQDINECYYWLNELCISVSVSNIRKIIGHVYYDFYYALNEENLISANELASLDLKQLVELLFQANSSPLVCLLCQTHLSKPKFIYLHNKKDAVDKDEISDFIRAVNKTHYDGICYHANKLLTEHQINSEQIVKALCLYYKSPFINKSAGMRDDLQYVMAVYARLSPNVNISPKIINQTTNQSYSIPTTIASFKLKRWHREETEKNNLRERLINDPLLIALGLSLATVSTATATVSTANAKNAISDIFRATSNYIKTQLNTEELKLFTGLSSEEDMQKLADCYTEILAEQKTKQQGWLEQIVEEYSPDVKRVEMLPVLASGWLRDVFPSLEGKMSALVKYKMLDIY